MVCDEATRKAMIAAREQFLKDAKKPQPEQPNGLRFWYRAAPGNGGPEFLVFRGGPALP